MIRFVTSWYLLHYVKTDNNRFKQYSLSDLFECNI